VNKESLTERDVITRLSIIVEPLTALLHLVRQTKRRANVTNIDRLDIIIESWEWPIHYNDCEAIDLMFGSRNKHCV
jgi:hypothetical protein